MTTQDDLAARVAACREQIAESPYSHTVAAGWYAEDVPVLTARLEEAEHNERMFFEVADAFAREKARVRELEAALRTLRQWDMLDACADGPWAKRLIDAALGEDKT
ncbi:MAG: hypothetical protein OEV62_03295 [Actinomycetota bacterium]|nr:hypothetical protein [Actinomycetota bacterium]MDH4352284.1 hypothetical protein [Gemmatimonadota bacterium]